MPGSASLCGAVDGVVVSRRVAGDAAVDEGVAGFADCFDPPLLLHAASAITHAQTTMRGARRIVRAG
jgi:hypothetical protein